ncbi:hypothetical protein BZG36_01864 [Bifiguratus adelaidae]|uniref:Protein YOP1 n=1 Tax=Bifiguratus adelaidae TaxID=1938954 RepID=A0A261Y2F2_9FUNG|nr:hypothetical protein BZG36_01864 [Bifiguratus adelaidae]
MATVSGRPNLTPNTRVPEAVTNNIGYYHAQLDKHLSQHGFLRDLEARTKVPKTTLVLIAAGLILLFIFFNIGAGLVTNILGWGYPAWASFRAIETPNKIDDTQWLVYWTVFGFINVLEYFVDTIVHWFPFWFIFKTLLILYLILPQTRGAEYLYLQFLRPVLLRGTGPVVNDGSLRNKINTRL